MIPKGVVLDNHTQKFYLWGKDGWMVVDGYAMVYKGIKMFVYRDKECVESIPWSVAVYETGMLLNRVAYGRSTKEEAIEMAIHIIDYHGVDSIKESINRWMEIHEAPYEGGV